MTEPGNEVADEGCGKLRFSAEKELDKRLADLTGRKLMDGAEDWQISLLGWVAFRLGELKGGEMVSPEVMDRILDKIRQKASLVGEPPGLVTLGLERQDLPVAALAYEV